MIAEFNETKLMDGVIPVLEFFKKQGIKITLGSASKNDHFLLKCLGGE